MAHDNFGKALGALILEKRRVQGLSQLQLSEDAFGTPSKVRRISELETGQVGNPHPKTIDPIIATLGITDSEITACARATNANVDTDLDRAYREARNLIDSLAYQFDHARPDASYSELEDFLRSKAKEWRQLQARVDQIDAADAQLEGLKSQANVALAKGEFEKVDTLLARIEEGFQQQRTLAEISKQADVRVTRGDTCLMREDPDGALAHYLKAARFFQPFDEEETVQILYDNAHKMYEAGIRTLRPRFYVGVRLLEEMLDLDPVKEDEVRRIRTHYQLGLILRNAASLQTGDEQKKLLESGIKHAQTAASQIVGAGDAYQLVSSKIALANCLLDKGTSYGDRKHLDEALATLASARVITLEIQDANVLLCHVSNSLGATALAIEQLTGTTLSNERINDILVHFNEAIENAERHFNLDVWGGAKINRARLFERLARQSERPGHERIFLRIQAISDYHASIETYPETVFPMRYAQAHFELANVMFQHGLTISQLHNELYLMRAIQYYEVASVIFESETALIDWAKCQMYIGSVFAHHAHLEGIQTTEHDLEQALRHFETAFKVFKEEGREDECKSCERSITRIRDELGSLSNSAPQK